MYTNDIIIISDKRVLPNLMNYIIFKFTDYLLVLNISKECLLFIVIILLIEHN